ncbi:DMT family transporter [Sutterella sp.]|uniref:DMT family transporter n=1 Tax=Sutterella sp. TaxID=1981025 RepID=UPI0026DF791D|nr:EamA family transporter [Sutterella sp.]MDO5531179.1 EamA family transporter [Sutterella sp.]
MKKAFLELHLSVLLAGWTGIFGKLLSLSPGLIVFWRIVFAGALLWAFLALRRSIEPVVRRDRIGIALVGALLMLQWTLFYASIKASNVSIAIVAFSSIGFFTAIFEPLMTHGRISLKEIAFSVLTLIGISFIFHFDTQYRTGIILGLVSAAGAAVLAILFRHYKAKYRATTVMSWQLVGGFVAACALMPLYRWLAPPEPFTPQGIDWLYMLIFSSFCTIGMYLLQIQSLEKISAFTVNLTYNLEPVYSIILAMIIFGEARDLGYSFYLGLCCIGASVLLQTWSVVRLQRKATAAQKRRAAAELQKSGGETA